MTLDNIFILLIILGIFSLILKYIVNVYEKTVKIKEKISAEVMALFIGEKTSSYLIPYLEHKASHLNLVIKFEGWKGIRSLNKVQLIIILDDFLSFLSNKDTYEMEIIYGLSKDSCKEEIPEIKEHIMDNKDRIVHMFDITTQEIEGRYQRKIGTRTFCFAIALAMLVNIDLFDLYSSFSKSSLVSEQLVTQSEDIRNKLTEQSEYISKEMDSISKEIELDERKPITDSKKELDYIITDIKKALENTNESVQTLNKNVKTTRLELGWTRDKFRALMSYEYGIFSMLIYKISGIFLSALFLAGVVPFWDKVLSSFGSMLVSKLK